MLSDEWPEMGHLSPVKRGGTSVSLMFYADNRDAVFDRAIKAGATVEKPVEKQFYGDRTGTLKDPLGYVWSIGRARRGCPDGRNEAAYGIVDERAREDHCLN